MEIAYSSLEIWKDIINFANFECSNYGNIRNKRTNNILKGHTRSDGYKEVRIKGKNYLYHRIVAMTWLKNHNNFEQINHIDGNKTNNKVCNLEWCTPKQNLEHAANIGLMSRGSNRYNSKLIESDIYDIRELIKNGKTILEISKLYNVSFQLISNIKRNKVWRHCK